MTARHVVKQPIRLFNSEKEDDNREETRDSMKIKAQTH